MAKISFRIKELELNVEAEPHEMPQINQAINNHFAGMIQPATDLASGEPQRKLVESKTVNANVNGNGSANGEGGGKGGKGRSSSRPKSSGGGGSTPIDYVPDASKWGFPNQDFTTAQKAIYVLYVVEQMTGATELSAGVIAATFNKYYKQAQTIRPNNVSKYLGLAKADKPALVAEDSTKSPSMWFLTTEGKRAAEQLIIAARGLTGQAAADQQ